VACGWLLPSGTAPADASADVSVVDAGDAGDTGSE
jgi:hypothetical protein